MRKGLVFCLASASNSPWRVLLVLLLLSSDPAHAGGPRTPEEINKLGDQALEMAQAGQLEEAIKVWVDLLDEVNDRARLDIHVNMGVAYKALQRLPEAWHHLALYLASSPSGACRSRPGPGSSPRRTSPA